METDSSHSQSIAKKVRNAVRLVLLMAKRGVAHTKHFLDLTLHLKRTNKLTGKSISSLLLAGAGIHHFSTSTTKSHSDARRKTSHVVDETATTMEAVQRVLEMIGGDEAAQPPVAWCRQLRVTDSPFPLKEDEEEVAQVNKAADEFIRKFYGDLSRQKSTPVDSPCRDT